MHVFVVNIVVVVVIIFIIRIIVVVVIIRTHLGISLINCSQNLSCNH